MLLSELLSLSKDLSEMQEITLASYLQKAYEIVVNDLRLSPGLFPMLMKSEHFCIDKFAYKATRVGSGSEIAFKEMRDFVECDFYKDGLVIENTNKVLIGYPEMQYFGFAKLDYDAMNNKHESNPELFQSKQHFHFKNISNITYGFCHMIGYQYPYPVLTGNSTYDDFHSYDIKTTFDTYGLEDLEVDETLGILMLLKANQLYSEDSLNLSNAKNYDMLCTTFVNYYNQNNESITNNRLTSLALMRF
jgi:hypothetical protein